MVYYSPNTTSGVAFCCGDLAHHQGLPAAQPACRWLTALKLAFYTARRPKSASESASAWATNTVATCNISQEVGSACVDIGQSPLTYLLCIFVVLDLYLVTMVADAVRLGSKQNDSNYESKPRPLKLALAWITATGDNCKQSKIVMSLLKPDGKLTENDQVAADLVGSVFSFSKAFTTEDMSGFKPEHDRSHLGW